MGGAAGSKKFVVGTPPGGSLLPRFLSRRYVHTPTKTKTKIPITQPATMPPITIPESGTPGLEGLAVVEGLGLALMVDCFAVGFESAAFPTVV